MQAVELWDGRIVLADGIEGGIPRFRWRRVPHGLATRRQLRDSGRRLGGQSPAALLVWRGGRRWAGLYRLDLALPRRSPSPAQRVAVAKALAARRRCASCGRDAGYVVPRVSRRCGDCLESGPPVGIPAPRPPHSAEHTDRASVTRDRILWPITTAHHAG